MSFAILALLLTGASALGADSSAPTNRLPRDPAELRQLAPAERQARIRELQERYGPGPISELMERRREELKNLPPEERRAKIQEWRAQRPGGPLPNPMSDAEREQYRKILRERLERQMATLEKQKTDGGLTNASDQRRLENLRQVQKYFEQASSGSQPPSIAKPNR